MDSTFVEITKMAKELAFFAKDTFTNIAPEGWEMVSTRIMVEAKLAIAMSSVGMGFSLICLVVAFFLDDEGSVAFALVGLVILVISSLFIYGGIVDIYSLDYATLTRIIETVK